MIDKINVQCVIFINLLHLNFAITHLFTYTTHHPILYSNYLYALTTILNTHLAIAIVQVLLYPIWLHLSCHCDRSIHSYWFCLLFGFIGDVIVQQYLFLLSVYFNINKFIFIGLLLEGVCSLVRFVLKLIFGRIKTQF